MENLALRVSKFPMSDVEINLWYYFRTLGLKSVQIKRAQDNYYELSLTQRKEFLQAPSTYHLCKTIIMENTAYDESASKDVFYPKYIAVIVQYEARLNAEKIMKTMKEYQNSHSLHKLSRKCFHFRHADEDVALELTGYGHNAITPFLMKNNIPVVLSKSILDLHPKYLWMGGGEVELKLGMSVEEFVQVLNPIISDTNYE
jgi:prolyl-tRNA editing enzyme YbaK/EbsC (Cys-tRNA(Pro) deacylase)